MTPDLLALLSKEQQEAWKHYELSAWPQLPHGYPAALLELAQAKAALAELWDAVDAAPHDKYCKQEQWCGRTFVGGCGWNSENGVGARHYCKVHRKTSDCDCDCWKSRLSK